MPRRRDDLPLVLLAWAVRVSALVAVVDTSRPGMREVNDRPFEDGAQAVTLVVAVLSAAVALLFADGLRRGRRRAWRVLTLVTALGVVTHLRTGSPVGLLVNAVLLGGLLAAAGRCRAEVERGTRWRAVRVLAVTASASVAGGLLLTARLAPRAGLREWLVQTLQGLVGATPDLPFAHARGAGLTGTVLAGLGASTVLLSALAFLAPARGRSASSDADDRRLRDLLDRWGERDSLGYFALRRDKLVVFAGSGRAAIAYRVVAGASLASGDPVGDPGAWDEAITAWLGEARRFAWVPGVVGASETGAAAYARAGLDAVEFGDEAVLDLTVWSLVGRPMRGVRQAVARARRAGSTVAVDRLRDLGPEELAGVRDAAGRFRDGEAERGFSMALGRLDAAVDPAVLVVRARDRDDALVALLVFVPWGTTGVSLDLMTRARTAVNGVVELAVATLAERGPDLGIRRVSLNFAVFRSAFERGARAGASPVSRTWRRVLVLASRWWQIESLYRANVKYAPDWVPRYVCYRSAAELPRVSLAALEAEAFLQRPRLLRVLGR